MHYYQIKTTTLSTSSPPSNSQGQRWLDHYAGRRSESWGMRSNWLQGGMECRQNIERLTGIKKTPSSDTHEISWRVFSLNGWRQCGGFCSALWQTMRLQSGLLWFYTFISSRMVTCWRTWRRPHGLWNLLGAISRLHDSAPRASGLRASAWKALADDRTTFDLIRNFVIECWESEVLPCSWEVGLLSILPKKGDLSLPGNYRGIMMLEVGYEIIGHILLIFV